MRTLLMIGLACTMLWPMTCVMAQDRWSVTDLGVGGARYINNSCEVAGTMTQPDKRDTPHPFHWPVTDLGVDGSGLIMDDLREALSGTHWPRIMSGRRAFFWKNGLSQDLGTLRGRDSAAHGMNNNGEVVGDSDPEPPQSTCVFNRAFLWKDGAMVELPTPRDKQSSANAINDSGLIAGQIGVFGSDPPRAVVWDHGFTRYLETLQPTASLDFYNRSVAEDTNNSGEVVGWSDSNVRNKRGYSCPRAVIWHNGKPTDLGTLGGPASWADAINDSGLIVGHADILATDGQGNNLRHACLWKDGKITDMGTLGGGWSWANDVNSSGQIVGWSHTKSGAYHAFLWRDGKLMDLNDLIPSDLSWELTDVSAINNSGVIVASGTRHGASRSLLIRPAD